MRIPRKLVLVLPLALVAGMVALAYGNVVFLRRSLNPVLLIPRDQIQLATGFSDIAAESDGRHGWHVDLANPAYLEWPVNLFIGRSLKAGHLPLVMPHQNLGIPLAGQYCHRIFSPYQIIANLFLPAGYDFFLVLRLVLAGVFAYLFLRPLCRFRPSALLGAAGFGLGSIMVIYSNHEEVANVAMLVPLLMWAVRAFFDRPGLARCCWLALALALVHTAGQPEIQLYVLLLALVYGLSRLLSLPAGRRRPALLSSLGAIVLSGLIAAPQILLFLLFHEEAWSYHPPGGELGLQSPMLFNHFLFTFFPRLRQTPHPWSYRTVNLLWDWVGGYFGLGLLVLAGAAANRPRRNRREILLFGLYFLFILGKNFGWNAASLLGLLPLFDQTWSPRWAAASWSFALAALAALGLDNLLDPEPESGPAAPDRPPGSGRITAIFNHPLHASGFLVLCLGLAIVFHLRGAAMWGAYNLRGYVFYNGLLFVFLAGAGFAIWQLLRHRLPGLGRYLTGSLQALPLKSGLAQFGILGILAAAACLALRWFPARHHYFINSEPVGSYLLAAPVLLAALAGLFAVAAAPANLGIATADGAALPLALAAGLADLPAAPMTAAWITVFVLDLAAVLFLPPSGRLKQILPPVFSALLLAGMAALAVAGKIFPHAEADRMLRWHLLAAGLILVFFSWLARRARGRGAGMGWLFLLAVWAELAVCIPRNHFDELLLGGYVPLLAIAALVITAVFLRKFLSPPRRIYALFAAALAAGGGVLLFLDSAAAPRLPRQSAPREPLPFVRFLQERQPHALTGVGPVLAPNFASAHGLSDLRGCVSMNTRDYQFFLENVLQVVPPDSSYSLWYTGDNPVSLREGSPYGNSQTSHIRAFERGFPFFRLAGARYIVCPPGVLDGTARTGGRPMMKIYSGEADIWEIPALPPAFIARKAAAVSMRGDTRLWTRAVSERVEILNGELVLLEEKPDSPLVPGDPLPSDRAELITGEDPNRLTVRFHSAAPGYLVVNRLHTNLLRAALEGEPLPVLPANGPFFAVPVPGGDRERELEITYLSPPVRWSYLLALAALAAVLAGLLAGGIRRRKQQFQGARR